MTSDGPIEDEAEEGWISAVSLADVPEGGIRALTIDGESIILSRTGSTVSCFENACAHMGMPIHRGSIKNGVITCPHHFFRFNLATGACLTAPSLELKRHDVRVIDDRIDVRLARAARAG